MRDIEQAVGQWLDAGKKVALATVVKVYGSAPRPLGAKMAVSAEGEMVGSVSGGCVESAVVQEALEILDQDKAKLIPFGISDETAWDVGLACGGTIEVFIAPLDEKLFRRHSQAIRDGHPVAGVTVLTGAHPGRQMLVLADGAQEGSIGKGFDARLDEAIEEALDAQESRRICLMQANGEEVELLIDVELPPERLVIVGAVHIAIPLVTIARALGLYTIVVDARGVFASEDRLGHADRLIQSWPGDALSELNLNESTYVVTLTHDEKLDNPALMAALDAPVRYIGALGSKRTHARRLEALREAGARETDLARIHGPTGLDLGGRSPAEIALAIAAEIVAIRSGRCQIEWRSSRTRVLEQQARGD